jgi:hypothetical protein
MDADDCMNIILYRSTGTDLEAVIDASLVEDRQVFTL